MGLFVEMFPVSGGPPISNDVVNQVNKVQSLTVRPALPMLSVVCPVDRLTSNYVFHQSINASPSTCLLSAILWCSPLRRLISMSRLMQCKKR